MQLCFDTEGKGMSAGKIMSFLWDMLFGVSMGNQEKKSRRQYSEISLGREKNVVAIHMKILIEAMGVNEID